MRTAPAALLIAFVALAAPAAAGARGGGSASLEGASGAGAGRIGWRLEGRHLTLRFARAIHATGRPTVGCVDDAAYERHLFDGGVYADGVSARIRLPRGARVVHLSFRRDIARRVNRCFLGATDVTMHLRRGRRAGCHPARHERVIARLGDVLVLRTHVVSHDVDGAYIGSDDAYRACRGRTQRPRTIATGGISAGGGSTNGETRETLFRAGGSHLAWSEVGSSDAYGMSAPTISMVDLDGAVRRPLTIQLFDVVYGTTVTELAVDPDGTLAYTLTPPTGPPERYVRTLDGQVRRTG